MSGAKRASLRVLASGLALTLSLGCATTSNYPAPDGPRYAEAFPGEPGNGSVLRVVTFNVEYGRKVERAIAALRSHPALRGADVLLLQEMDAPGVLAMARALGMSYVYFPASHEEDGRDMGNAILSPWPIDGGRKILLPHTTRIVHRARAAVTARVHVGGRPIQVYSIHLGSPLGMSGGGRRDQAESVLRDAETSPDPVIIAGDFNSKGIGEQFVKRGYAWPTRSVGRSVMLFSFDHVFVRGLPDTATAGVAREVKDASDHRPVWVTLALSPDR